MSILPKFSDLKINSILFAFTAEIINSMVFNKTKALKAMTGKLERKRPRKDTDIHPLLDTDLDTAEELKYGESVLQQKSEKSLKKKSEKNTYPFL